MGWSGEKTKPIQSQSVTKGLWAEKKEAELNQSGPGLCCAACFG